jgi:hypothetical protein
LKPGNAARQLYGLDREILLWCSTYSTFQARDIDAMLRVVDASGARLSRQFAILATRYTRESRSSFESEAALDQSLVHVSLQEIREFGLDSLLAVHLYSRDLFDVSGAALRSTDFFGRRDLIDRLVSEVETGTSQVGLFGLRKVGKTSVLNRAAEKLRNSSKVVVARLDLQWSTSINGRPEYTLWATGESVHAAHRAIRNVKGLRLFGKYATFSDVPSAESIWEWFAHDVTLIMNATSRRICILIDEIERMYEKAESRGFVRFWRLLRGLDQQYPGRLRFVVGGTSPQCAELGTVAGEDNPLFNYLQLEYLGPLSVADSSSLLMTLGGTMGLGFSPSSVDWVMQQSGGHPALVRAIGSTVHQSALDRKSRVEVDEEILAKLDDRVTQRVAPILDQMVAALRDQYADEYQLLEWLALGQLKQFKDYASIMPVEVRRLERFGLIDSTGTPTINLRQLHSHVIRSSLRELVAPGPANSLLEQGSPIGDWVVESCVASGGFADVYRVRRGAEFAAAKVLKFGQLSALQREVDVLSELDHKNIVKIYDTVRTQGGSPCLLMEYLEGKTAAHFCDPATAPSSATWIKWMAALLDALEVMHPRSEVAAAFASREVLDSADFVEWGKAKHGYLHRDVKPENIVVVDGRGPVLIDFNIAVRSGAPVLTTSASDGYAPTVSVEWSPSVDLYALGVTGLELAAGTRLSSCSIEELREMAESRHSGQIMELIDLLLRSGEEVVTVQSAKAALFRIRRT